MKFHNQTPIYRQIAEHIGSNIICGNLKSGDRIPSVREMSAQIMVNASTVQRAYQELEETGLIFNERGMGKFVTKSQEAIALYRDFIIQEKVRQFLENMYQFNLHSEEILAFVKEEMEKKGENNDSSNKYN